MNTAELLALDLSLPESAEAHEPPEARGLSRDAVRMLVSHSHSDRLVHARFIDFPDFLRAGDLLVLNVSGTLPAALTARREDGSELALHLSTELPAGLQVVEFRAADGPIAIEHIGAGEQFELPAGGRITTLAPHPGSARLWVARLELPQTLQAYLAKWGRPIAYPYLSGSWPIELYQNVYAAEPGSAEMASAGRPFTAAMLDRLAERGVLMTSVVLHSGVSSLEPDEPPVEEYFAVSHEAAAALTRAQRDRHRVIAVGTTTVRALESSLDAAGRPIASRGWTELVIDPWRGLQVVDGLLTGFHEPNASHLDLVSAVATRGQLERAYRAALEHGYLWHEFGDVHLILPN